MAWFIAPYVRLTPPQGTGIHRGCVVRNFQQQITADGGKWRAVEILGDRAIVKVVASATTLAAIAATPGVTRLPLDLMDDSLSSLTNGQRNAVRTLVLDAGYSASEIDTRFSNLANNTVRDVLRFLATRRRKPRYDEGTDQIICDGPIQACESVDLMDREV